MGLAGWTGSEKAEVLKALQRSVELGCNFFDTAWAYGDGVSEEVLNQLLKNNADKRLYAASKIPPKNRKWPSKPDYNINDVFPSDYIVDYTERSLKILASKPSTCFSFMYGKIAGPSTMSGKKRLLN